LPLAGEIASTVRFVSLAFIKQLAALSMAPFARRDRGIYTRIGLFLATAQQRLGNGKRENGSVCERIAA
jgi:hypothetical protein